jgi:hypothetical protein
MEKILKNTLEELENDYWNDAPANSSSLVKVCHQLRKKKLIDFEPEDLRIMINQNFSLKYLVPIAVDILKKEPFVETIYYEGDLLKSVLSSDEDFWKSREDLKNDVMAILKENTTTLDRLDTTKEIKEELETLFHSFLNTTPEKPNLK